MADDTVAVLTGESPHVRMIPLHGEPGRSLGASGMGPNELNSPLTITAAGSRALVVGGQGLRLLQDSEEWVEITGEAEMFSAFQISDSPGGSLVVALERGRWPETGFQLAVFSGAMERLAEVPIPESVWVDDEPNSYHAIGHAIRDDGVIAVGAGRGVYRITLLDGFTGNVISEATRAAPPLRRSRDEIREIRANLSDIPLPDGMVQQDYETKPWFNATSFRFDGAGRLWIRTLKGTEGQTIFDVFSQEMTYLGEVRVEAEMDGFFDIRGGTLVASYQDSTGVPSVGIWRVVDSQE